MSETRHDGFLPGRHAIDAYGEGGFRFGGVSHKGSILILPSGVRRWAAQSPADIDPASLADLFLEEPGAIEILIVGTGLGLVPLSQALRARLSAAGLRADPMATGPAARTYNVLHAENRRVAAALLAVA